MLRQKSVPFSSHNPTSFSLRRQRRAVLVTVEVDGREVDTFEVSEPHTLRAALRPIYMHLPVSKGNVKFQAVDEEWLPFRFAHSRRQSRLDSLAEALEHIAA